MMSKFINKFSLKENKNHQSYQIYDRITFEEIDDASNAKLAKLPQNVLYETNHLSLNKNKRIFLIKSKDYSANNEVTIKAVTRKDLEQESKIKSLKLDHKKGYYHIAAIQILIKWLGNAGIDIPVKISIRDKRILDLEKSIMGLWSTNLYTGAVYTVMGLDYLVSASDKNIDDCLVLDIKAGIDLKEDSKALSISTQIYISWINAPHPLRKRDGEFGLENLKEGKSIYLKPNEMDISTVPQPIPLKELSYELDFLFNNRENNHIKAKSSNEVDYKLKTENTLKVTLKQPRYLGSSSNQSRRFSQQEMNKITGSDSEDE